jgi:hypothetical protein
VPGTDPPRPPPPPSRTGDRATSLPPSRLSDSDKEALTIRALGLLREQVHARIVHYKAELETSPELDAVTAQVVEQLRAMQAAIGPERPSSALPEDMEAQQIRLFARLLERLLARSGPANFAGQNLKPVGRRIAQLFFESELHEKSQGDRSKVIAHAEQGVYYVLGRYRHRLRAELEGFQYKNEDIRLLTLDLLEKLERDLKTAFLSRRSPELNRVMHVFMQVLTDFLTEHLPPRAEQMAKLTIRYAQTARQPDSLGHKVRADRFGEFRSAWERLMVEQMVFYCGDELYDRLTSADQPFQEATVAFFQDPRVFSETCEVLCDALYDFLCQEGFLELPLDWRAQYARG